MASDFHDELLHIENAVVDRAKPTNADNQLHYFIYGDGSMQLLNAERLPRVSPPETEDTIESVYINQDRQRRYCWTWNIPLLLASITIVVVGGSALAGAYLWQSKRLSSEMLNRAAAAEQAEDYKSQVRWLTRYVRLAPEDTEALIRLGIATDNAVQTNRDLDAARIRLSQAIAATGELSAFETQRAELRRRLIKRLLQLGDIWTAEAQRQVIFLSAKPEDSQALSWLAKAMAGQNLAGMSKGSQSDQFDKDEHYWQWLAEQPVGLVLRTALEHNPNDLELASLFMNAVVVMPEWFQGSDEVPSPEQLQKEADDLCERLAAMTDNGQAQWLTYLFKRQQDAETAAPLLKAALPGALARLNENLEVASETEADMAQSEQSLSAIEATPLLDDDSYQPSWDWELALSAAAQATVESRPADAQAIYEELMKLASPAISRNQREATYLAAGRAYWTGKETEKAIEAWTTGLHSLNGSIPTADALLTALIELGRTEDAENAIKDLDAYIDQQFSELDGAKGIALTPAFKEQARQRLELARWRADVYRGNLLRQHGDYRGASQRLAKAFGSPLTIDADTRIQSGRLLADCYGKLQLWDLAGQTLDQCVVMRPTDVSLRRSAAEAWRLLGAPERAASQLEALDDGSFSAALEIARLKATAEASQPPEQRDFEGVRQAIQVARLRWESMPESERALQPIWSLEFLEIAFAERDPVSPESGYARIEDLAAKYATNSEVQLLAVSNLARGARTDSAKLALLRLQKIAEVSGKPEDAGNAIVAQAIIAESTEDVDAALRIAREGISAVPQDALRLAKLGASIAVAHKQNAVGYALLKLVPEEKWDVDALMTAGRIGMAGDSAHGLAITDSDLQRWESRLRTLEGEDGCNWRYMAGKRLIGFAAHSSNRSQLLDEAQKYFQDIDRIRPRWGMGAALGGQIAALKGSHEEAVGLLRRAIRDGDTQASTILLLVAELTALAQFDEAEQELKRLAAIPESVLSTSMWEIALAQKKGDLRAALDLARKSTTRNRNDANSWLVASQTALALWRSPETSLEEKTTLRAEAWDALEHAARITEGKDANVWNARFRFHAEAGDYDKAKQELKALETSPLPATISLVAAANGYLLLQDFETAQARVKEAMALDPNAAQPHVVMARILERMGDRQGVLSELQAAHRLDQENVEIRERLAVASVLTSEKVPWSEVDELLSDNTDSTKSQLLRAALSVEHGDEDRKQKALTTLESMAATSSAAAMTAKRVLAKHFTKQFVQASPEERELPSVLQDFEKARFLYEELLETDSPEPADGVAFALLLIEAQQLDEAKRIADKLSAAGTSPLALQLRLRIAKLQGDDLSSVASAWIANASGFEEEQLWETVGKTMSQLELHDDAIAWLEKAYRKDPTKFRAYAVGLAKAGQTDQAINLCVSIIQKGGNLEAATLLPQIVLLNPAEQQSEAVEQALTAAIKDHGDSAPLLDAVATLRLMQERYAESVALYEQCDRLAPNRPGTLNNLAIALVELPMRNNAALERINKAIQLYGRHPQFLDTLAIVQSKLGEHAKAKATLEEALAREKDPRYQMRLAEALIALGNPTEAKSVWEQVEIEQLKALGLTPVEQRSLTKLSKELGLH